MEASNFKAGGRDRSAVDDRAPRRRRLACGSVILLAILWGSTRGEEPTALSDLPASVSAAHDEIQFNRDIRPILSEHCFACHGPDARQRKAGLRLDVEAGAKAELDSGLRAIVGGMPGTSELIARITSAEPSERMPPPESGKTLSAAQIELLTRWINAGAPWQGHWSLQPIGNPIPPVVDPAEDSFEFLRNPIDAFLFDRQRAHQLTPSPPADRVTLLRRVHFDLLGLPPSPDEVERFLADTDPDAFDKVVDRLLASPHFGERMAVVWLDLVRYADSIGLYADQASRVSPYRDYVIASFNTNKPFDRFTIEQLAGDLLPGRTQEQHIASAYNRLGRMSTESGVQEKEYLAKYIAERVRNVGTTWLGLTLACCECHDHKFDPLAARDFYRMEAYFADIKERGVYDKDGPAGIDMGPSLRMGTPAQLDELAQLFSDLDKSKEEMERLKEAYRDPTPQLAAEQTAWERTLERAHDWRKLSPGSVVSAAGASCQVLPDGSVLISGTPAETDGYTIRARVPLTKFTALRLEALPDPALPARGPGRSTAGNFVLTGLTVAVGDSRTSTPRRVEFRSATATFEQTDAPGNIVSRVWNANAAIRPDPRNPELGWSITDQTGVAQQAIFETEADIECGTGAELTIVLRHDAGDGRTLGRFRLSVADAARPVEVFGYRLPQRIRALLGENPWMRTRIEKGDISDYYATNVSAAGRAIQDRQNGLTNQLRLLNATIPSVLVTEAVEPRPIRVLKRGNWQDATGEPVEPGVPGSLPQPAAKSGRATRLDLAQWIVAPDNPLPARVLVNRLWKLGFGAALSRKTDDLGSQGEWPTHPELLDWLARRLIDSGWDVKHVLRLIVTSGAYRQSSTASADARERDPENRWLARQSRFRLEAELVRDNALAVSGLLAPSIGGPSVFPYQPAGYWSHLNKPPRHWIETAGEGIYRRGIYTHWQRQYLHPMLSAFDAPSREECAADRPRSNTPMQALVLLNDPTFVEAARVLAERALREEGDRVERRITWLFREVLSRDPERFELETLRELLERHLAGYRDNPSAAQEFLAVGRARPTAGADEILLAAWTNVARVVLNLHDVVTRK